MKLTLRAPGGREIIIDDLQAGALLSEAISRAGIARAMPCGGSGRCGKCKTLATGALSPLSDEEMRLLSPDEIAMGVRLACRCRALGDAEIILPERAQMEIPLDYAVGGYTLSPKPGLGVAVDIGTTTLAAYLFDLQSGARICMRSLENPQRAFGADVISRVQAALEGKLQAQSECVREAIASLCRSLCADAGVDTARLRRLAVTGNTAMLHLFASESPKALAAAPFEITRYFGERLSASALIPELSPECELLLPRCISAFVGADITTAILSSGLLERETPAMLIDIGTNGEIALWTGRECLCCSTAAGPAFEGAGISCGGAARAGAVDKVWVEEGKIKARTIGGGKATHICGSGLIDAVAAALELGMLQPGGRIEGGAPIEIAEGVSLNQADIRAVQLAKAAICGGMLTLIEKSGLPIDQIEKLCIAGGFGSRMRAESAVAIGLIPPALLNRAEAIGNAAGAGAIMTLLDDKCMSRCDQIARSAKSLELSFDPVFMDNYVEQMAFGSLE